MRNKVLAVLTSGALLISAASVNITANAAVVDAQDSAAVVELQNSNDPKTYGDFEYIVLDNGTVEISKYKGSDSNVDIPNKIDGKAVISIGIAA